MNNSIAYSKLQKVLAADLSIHGRTEIQSVVHACATAAANTRPAPPTQSAFLLQCFAYLLSVLKDVQIPLDIPADCRRLPCIRK